MMYGKRLNYNSGLNCRLLIVCLEVLSVKISNFTFFIKKKTVKTLIYRNTSLNCLETFKTSFHACYKNLTL